MKNNRNEVTFFELLKAGLWEKEPRLSQYEDIDYAAIMRMAEEQSVIGLVTAGLEQVKDVIIPQKWTLQLIGSTLQIEQRNRAMNAFIESLVERFYGADINAVLVKGQGIAQCYERPLWRACGDVDLLLEEEGYERAKAFLMPTASEVETEFSYFKHLGMTIDGWEVELHGTLWSRLSRRIDCEIDKVQRQVFSEGSTRVWKNSSVDVCLPAPNEDVIFVFTHILHHFFFEGIGLRQICDWCRLLWTYRYEIDSTLLEKRLRRMGLMSEWKVFAAFAVDSLGMPVDTMPLYDDNPRWKRKAEKIRSFVMQVGNFGHNSRRNYTGQSYLLRKINSFWGRLSDMLRHLSVFPKDSIVFFGGVIRSGFHAFLNRE